MLDGDKDRIQEDKNDDEPVEGLTLDKAANAKSETHTRRRV